MTEPTPKDPPAVTNPANRALTTRRDTLLASLGRAEAFLVDYDAERDERQVAIRLEHLENVWASLEEVQMQLECAEESEEGRALHAEVRADFEERFLIIKSDLTSKLPVITNETEVPQTVHPTSALSGLKLPTISLPEFDGDYMQWLGFHDTFLALIHSNAEVPAIQKFHYLKAALKGEAAQLIESIAISAANYNLAWTTLVGRYANEYLLKKRHLQAIFDIQRMKRETAATLHGLVDEFERHVKTLKQMGEPTDQWSSILEHLLCTRLHDDTLKAWEDHASTLQTPSYSCLVEFLQRRMRVLESISVNHHASPSSANQSHQNARRPQQFRLSSHASTTKAGKRCPVCDKDHFIAKCQKFLELPIAKRQQVVYRKRLCLKCLRGDHVVKNCDSDGSCRTCDRQHHTLLHAEARENSQRTNSETHFSSTPAVVQIPTSVQPE